MEWVTFCRMSCFDDLDMIPMLTVDLQDKKKEKEKISAEDVSGPLTFGTGIGELCYFASCEWGGWVGGQSL